MCINCALGGQAESLPKANESIYTPLLSKHLANFKLLRDGSLFQSRITSALKEPLIEHLRYDALLRRTYFSEELLRGIHKLANEPPRPK
jgi:hypothetical protein